MRVLMVLILGLVSASPAAARTVEVSPNLGYRFGTHLNTIDGELRIDSGATTGVFVDVGLQPGRYLELGYSRHMGTLTFRDEAFGGETAVSDLTVHTIQAGGLLELRPGAVRPFVVLTAGAVVHDPEPVDRSTETRFLGAFGGGAKVYLGTHIGLRADVRLHGIYFTGDSLVFCGPESCYVTLASRFVARGELSGGLVVSF